MLSFVSRGHCRDIAVVPARFCIILVSVLQTHQNICCALSAPAREQVLQDHTAVSWAPQPPNKALLNRPCVLQFLYISTNLPVQRRFTASPATVDCLGQWQPRQPGKLPASQWAASPLSNKIGTSSLVQGPPFKSVLWALFFGSRGPLEFSYILMVTFLS